MISYNFSATVFYTQVFELKFNQNYLVKISTSRLNREHNTRGNKNIWESASVRCKR